VAHCGSRAAADDAVDRRHVPALHTRHRGRYVGTILRFALGEVSELGHQTTEDQTRRAPGRVPRGSLFAPQAYRRLPDVLAHHAGTVKIEHTLRPFAVLMAGANVFATASQGFLDGHFAIHCAGISL
jgi:hypothetical protein